MPRIEETDSSAHLEERFDLGLRRAIGGGGMNGHVGQAGRAEKRISAKEAKGLRTASEAHPLGAEDPSAASPASP